MENNEEFKRVVASIKDLEQQLLKIDDTQLNLQGIKSVCTCVCLVEILLLLLSLLVVCL
jgi:hypothetical protein